ncbi:unnamed protein product [Closterium sp. NIES-64]|nr:unnamed protein product [Closterium sp. NIES-64]
MRAVTGTMATKDMAATMATENTTTRIGRRTATTIALRGMKPPPTSMKTNGGAVGSDDEMEEWRPATGDDSAEADDEADAEADDEAEVEAAPDAVAPADVVAIADADATEGGADDDPWSMAGDDDVPLLKRRLRHRLQTKPKHARVVLSDDDSPGEELQPRISAAEKGKTKVADAPAKATICRCPSTKKQKNDGDPGSSTGAAKKKKKGPNKDDIMVNEALGSDDDYAEAAGPIPSFPEKAKPKDPTLHNPNSRPPSPRSKDSLKRHRGWTWIAEAWDQVPKQVIIDAFRHCGISSKLDGTEDHLVMSHLRARSTVNVFEDMSLGRTTGDNTRLLGQAPEEEEEEGVREVVVATGLEVLYQETPNCRRAAAEADRMIEPRETARHAWRVPDLGVDPAVSAREDAVTEEG